MADIDGTKQEKKDKEFFTQIPQESPGYFLKGSHQYDWGLKNRLSRVFNPKDGRTLMLAFDHGYFQGPTTGLERIDQTILPLEPYVDCLMLTRGIQRSVVPASTQKAIALRASGGTSMVSLMDEWESTGSEPGLRRPGYEPLSNESLACSIEDALRLNASVLAVQVFIGSQHERQTLENMTRLIDEANRYGIAVHPDIIQQLERHRDLLQSGDKRVSPAAITQQRSQWAARDPVAVRAITENSTALLLRGFYAGSQSESDLLLPQVVRAATKKLFITDVQGNLFAADVALAR